MEDLIIEIIGGIVEAVLDLLVDAVRGFIGKRKE